MDSPALIPLVLTAVAGLAALELRQARASIIALGAALGFFAIGMLVIGAAEVGVGVFVAGAVLMMAFKWGFRRTGEYDSLPSVLSGRAGGLAIGALVAFAIVAFLVAPVLIGLTPLGVEETYVSGHMGLLREVIVILTAAAAVWAMLRKTGRRDE